MHVIFGMTKDMEASPLALGRKKNYDHWAKEEGMKDTQGIGAVKNQPQHSPSWWRDMRTLIHLVTLSFLL